MDEPVSAATCRSISPFDQELPPPIKMRRAMTVIGPSLVYQQDPEPILPSYMEPGKDMIRRITSQTVSFVICHLIYNF